MITSKQINEQEVTARDGARIRYERTGRRTDADLCSLRRTEQETGRRCCRTYTDDPRNSASLLETLQQKLWSRNGEGARTEREGPKSVRQHFVLSTRDPFFFVVAFLL